MFKWCRTYKIVEIRGIGIRVNSNTHTHTIRFENDRIAQVVQLVSMFFLFLLFDFHFFLYSSRLLRN